MTNKRSGRKVSKEKTLSLVGTSRNLRRVRARSNFQIDVGSEFPTDERTPRNVVIVGWPYAQASAQKAQPRNRAEHRCGFIKLGRAPTTCVINFCVINLLEIHGLAIGLWYDGAYRPRRYTGRPESP